MLNTKGILTSHLTALIISISFLLALQSCSTLGYENVDTSRKAIVVSIAEVRAVNLLLQDLIGRRAISRESAEQTLNNLIIAKDQLQSALYAIDFAGDPATATSNIQRANIAMSLALNLLAPLVEN